MRFLRIAALSVVLGALSAASVGQESPPAPQPAPDTQRSAPTAPPAPAPKAPPERVNDDEFIPTEELSADEEVTFPVGI